MKLGKKEVTIAGPNGPVRVKRVAGGVPKVSAGSLDDAYYGQGWAQAQDRQMQVLLTRVVLGGRAAELLDGSEEMIEVDRFIRSMGFARGVEEQIAVLEPRIAGYLEAFAAGFNQGLADRGRVFEARLLGYKPEPWTVADSLVLGRAFSFVGLVDAQGAMEKLIVQLVQHGVEEEKLRELFPYLSEEIDYELLARVELAPPLAPETVKWLKAAGTFTASNNWVVSGQLTASGRPMLCGDIHLEVNRLPSIWQEIVLETPERKLMGVSIPGAPGVVAGRSNRLAWSPTYSFMDTIDFRIEHCKDGGYRRGEAFKPFERREEIIKVKKGQPVTHVVYENEHGLLEGDPGPQAYRLVLGWAARGKAGASEFNGLLGLAEAQTVEEAREKLKLLVASPYNWALADAEGNIGYQMSGRHFDRPPGVSGLLALPGWEEKFNPRGLADPGGLPSLVNPEEGFIVTANEDLNHLGSSAPINLAMADYRSRRIKDLLAQGGKLTAEDMKRIHYDLFSLQAERFMALIRPRLPQTENGRRLAAWDLTYRAESLGATLFERVYRALIEVVFGLNNLGPEVVRHIWEETGVFNDYYVNFDRVLLSEGSAWLNGQSRESVLDQAIEKGLAQPPVPYGHTRRVMLENLLLGGRLPRLLGFDHGPIELPGSRATITQGQIFKRGGRVTTFSPGARMVADLDTGQLEIVLAGGPSDRRFSGLYTSDLENWFNGVYKILE